MGDKVYIARNGRVWRNIKSKEVVGKKLKLKKDETLLIYEEVSEKKAKEEDKQVDKAKEVS